MSEIIKMNFRFYDGRTEEKCSFFPLLLLVATLWKGQIGKVRAGPAVFLEQWHVLRIEPLFKFILFKPVG